MGGCAAALFIVLLFSYPAQPILHGFQPLVGLLLFCGVAKLRELLRPGWFWAVVLLQIASNVALLWLRAADVGVHLPQVWDVQH